MDALTRRKNGEWQCKFGEWHTKKQDCRCSETKTVAMRELWPKRLHGFGKHGERSDVR
jgi:hypothetical protein